MTKTWRGLLPIGLGLLAAACYWAAVYRAAGPVVLVRVNKDMEAGATFEESNIETFTVHGDSGSLVRTCVPYEERAVLIGRQTDRALRRGDPVLWRDAAQAPIELTAEPGEQALAVSLDGVSVVPRLLVVGGQVGFLVEGPAGAAGGRFAPAGDGSGNAPMEYVGPFRVLSVGERLSRLEPGDRSRSGGAGFEARVITVAIRLPEHSRSIDESARRLVESMGAGSGRSGRIRAVVLKPIQRHQPAEVAAVGR